MSELERDDVRAIVDASLASSNTFHGVIIC